MKKYIFTVILLMFSVLNYGQKISFSVIVEPQMSWMGTDVKTVSSDGSVFGFNAGLVFDKYFAENYAFSSGIFLWNTGGNLNYSDSTEIGFRSGNEILEPNTSMRYRLQYITVPVALKLNSNQIGYTSFYAHLGINNHINVKKSADVASLDIEKVGIPDEIQLFNMSYFIGGGVEYSLGGTTAILGGIYYTHGFLDVTTSNDYRATLNAVSLRVGVRF